MNIDRAATPTTPSHKSYHRPHRRMSNEASAGCLPAKATEKAVGRTATGKRRCCPSPLMTSGMRARGLHAPSPTVELAAGIPLVLRAFDVRLLLRQSVGARVRSSGRRIYLRDNARPMFYDRPPNGSPFHQSYAHYLSPNYYYLLSFKRRELYNVFIYLLRRPILRLFCRNKLNVKF